jgi:hypothetical protein
MSDYKYDMSDLVSAAATQKPLDFEAAFNDLIVDRIATAINDKKISVAQQMYGYTTDNEETEEELEDHQDGETA